jgi:hypothetical protein
MSMRMSLLLISARFIFELFFKLVSLNVIVNNIGSELFLAKWAWNCFLFLWFSMWFLMITHKVCDYVFTTLMTFFFVIFIFWDPNRLLFKRTLCYQILIWIDIVICLELAILFDFLKVWLIIEAEVIHLITLIRR